MSLSQKTSANILLEQDRAETRVESTNALVLQNLAKATDKTVGEVGLGDETDTGSLKRAEGDISEELGRGGRGEVDGGAVLRGCLIAEEIDALLLEELISTELEGALKEVAGSGGTETRPDSAGTLIGDNLPEAADETAVVRYGVELNSRLDAGRC